MYLIYLYSNRNFKKVDFVQYGYWSGKSYTVNREIFPDCSKEPKRYISLKRAINAGEKAKEKYQFVCGFDIDDENGNAVYESNRI